MVNVGGRSKGCSPCRRRRIKCDESQPVCKQCEKHNFECTGTRGITFIPGKIVNSRRTEKRRNIATVNNDSADLRIPPMVSLKKKETMVYIGYIMAHPMLSGGPVALALKRLQPNEFILAGTIAATRQIFPRAAASFATVVFGAHHRESQIINHGYAMYGVALKQLNQALSEPECYTHDEVVLSVVTLALLECWMPSGPKNYLKHMVGVERLLELRGPDPKFLEFHKGLRHMILFASLRTKKLSILSRPEWKTAFRMNCSDKELQEQDLYDILADCTALVAERDDILAAWELNPKKDIKQYYEVEKKAVALLTHLYAWKKLWDNDEKKFYFDISTNEDDPPPFPTIFEFSRDLTATMLLFYNSALIHVLRILNSLQLDNRDEYIAAEWSAALDICRCIPYYTVREAHLDLRVVHLAIVTVWTTLRGRETAPGRWIVDVLNNRSRALFAQGLWAD